MLKPGSRQLMLKEIGRLLEAAKAGRFKAHRRIVRALTVFLQLYRTGDEKKIEDYQDLLPFYPDYNAASAKADDVKRACDSLGKDIVELRKWLPKFNRSSLGKKSIVRISVSRAKRKVKLLVIKEKGQEKSKIKKSISTATNVDSETANGVDVPLSANIALS